VPFPSQLESQYAYPGTGESCREIVCIWYRVESDGFSGTTGINPCSSMLMAAPHVFAECDLHCRGIGFMCRQGGGANVSGCRCGDRAGVRTMDTKILMWPLVV